MANSWKYYYNSWLGMISGSLKSIPLGARRTPFPWVRQRSKTQGSAIPNITGIQRGSISRQHKLLTDLSDTVQCWGLWTWERHNHLQEKSERNDRTVQEMNPHIQGHGQRWIVLPETQLPILNERWSHQWKKKQICCRWKRVDLLRLEQIGRVPAWSDYFLVSFATKQTCCAQQN